MELIQDIASILGTTALDVLPVAMFLLMFHRILLGRRLQNLPRVIAGLAFVVVGLGVFLLGLEKALFPIGWLMAEQLAQLSVMNAAGPVATWADFSLVYAFAFTIAFGTTIAEPALLAVALKAREVSGGAIHVWGLRVVVALGVATGVALGCFRIVTGTPLHWYIATGYVLVILQASMAPKMIVPLAFDSGGVSTSTVTVPIVAALGLGLAENVAGRNPLIDGFGLIAFACLFPILAVLTYAQIAAARERYQVRRALTANRITDVNMES